MNIEILQQFKSSKDFELQLHLQRIDPLFDRLFAERIREVIY